MLASVRLLEFMKLLEPRIPYQWIGSVLDMRLREYTCAQKVIGIVVPKVS